MRTANPSGASKPLGFLAALAAMVMWGCGPILTKEALTFSDPIFLLVVQLAGSIAFLLAMTLILRVRLSPRGLMSRVAGIGVLEPGIGYGLGNMGLVLTTASAATLVNNCEFLFVVLFSVVILKQYPGRLTLISLALVMTGIMLISVPTLGGDDKFGSFAGNSLVMLGDIAAGLYIVLSSKYISNDDPLAIALYQQIVSFVLVVLWFLGFLASGREVFPGWSLMDPRLGFSLLSGVIEFGPPFWLFLVALKHLKANTVALMQAFIPIVTIICARVFLSEQMAVVQIIGGAVIIAALLLSYSAETSLAEGGQG